MNIQQRLADVAGHLEHQLREEFPHWRIRREDSGGWIAASRAFGLLHAASAGELRERLLTPPVEIAET